MMMTPEQGERSAAAIQAVYDLGKPEYQYRELSPTKEYQAELGRQLIYSDDPNHGLKPSTDIDIAMRMHIAGYSPQEIAVAVQEGSPQAAHEQTDICRVDGNTAHGVTVATYVTSQKKVRDLTFDKAKEKLERGLTETRRLDRLDLATEVNLYYQQSYELSPVQEHEVERGI